MAAGGGELARRVAVALVGIPLALILAYLGGYVLATFLAVMAGLGAWEFCRMYRQAGKWSAPAAAGLLAAALLFLAVGSDLEGFLIWATLSGLVVGSLVILTTPPERGPGLAAVLTLFGAGYTGLLLSFAVWIRDWAPAGSDLAGTAVLFLPVAVTWLGDTAAYFGGRALGRHRLAPRTSPNKTWEGAAAGFVAGAAGAWLYVELTRPLVPWSVTASTVILFGAAIAVAGQVGDLFESRVKRDCGVKDSSSLIPGHGGVLDRMDSLLFVFPVAFAYLWLVGV